jgi:hypothetical protein
MSSLKEIVDGYTRIVFVLPVPITLEKAKAIIEYGRKGS